MTIYKYYPEKYAMQGLSIGKQLAGELRIRIMSESIPKHAILSENQIAKEYHVSRSPVREALKVLEDEKLLRLERMGVVILGVSEKDIEEIYDVRLMIESFVMQRILQQDNRKLLNELEKIYQMMLVSIKFKDVDEFALLDINFHDRIIRSIGHQQIEIVWNQLRPVMESLIILSMRYRFLTNFSDFERIIENHAMIIEAIRTKHQNIIEKVFSSNFNDVQNQVEDLWTDAEMLKKVRDYVEA